jgi:hypothetical protein
VTPAETAGVEYGTSLLDRLHVWFHRLVAGYCMLFGIFYWVRLIGYYDGPLWRFDTMPPYWQVVAVTLAVFFPFASAGLWMMASWGPVIWFICAATEVVMFTVFPQLFGRNDAVVASHLLAATLYLVFRILLHLRRRRQLREG